MKKFIGHFFFINLILIVISVVIDYTEKADAFASKNVAVSEILRYFMFFIPYIVGMLFPLFIFISTIFFTSKMASRTEVIAILATGTTFLRFLQPFVVIGAIVCGFAMFCNHLLVPYSNHVVNDFQNKYIRSVASSSDDNVYMRLSKQQYVFMEKYDYKGNMGYRLNAELLDGEVLKERIFAERASYDSVKRLWKLYNVVVRQNNGMMESLTYADELYKAFPNYKPEDLTEANEVSATLNTPELLDFINLEELRGRENLNMYYVDLYKRTSNPVAGLLMVIMGACIASKKVRGGSGVHLALGVAISGIYMMLLQLSSTFSINGGLHPLLAAWFPNIIFTFVTIYIVRQKVK
jgi:lipopolysaccharide export system permease protein